MENNFSLPRIFTTQNIEVEFNNGESCTGRILSFTEHGFYVETNHFFHYVPWVSISSLTVAKQKEKDYIIQAQEKKANQ